MRVQVRLYLGFRISANVPGVPWQGAGQVLAESPAVGCGCGPRWPLHINTHGDSGEYHSGHKWYLRPMTSDVASYVRLRRGRSVIWIVAPG